MPFLLLLCGFESNLGPFTGFTLQAIRGRGLSQLLHLKLVRGALPLAHGRHGFRDIKIGLPLQAVEVNLGWLGLLTFKLLLGSGFSRCGASLGCFLQLSREHPFLFQLFSLFLGRSTLEQLL